MLKLNRLQLQNYKGFTDIKFDFNNQLTCIAGINGSGKTTILGAIEKSMLIFLNTNNLGSYRKPKYALNATDVHIDKNASFSEQNETASTKLEFTVDGNENEIEHSFEKIGRTGNYHSSNYNGNGFKDAKNCPIFAFYSINRRNVSAKKRNQNAIDGFDYIFSAWENVNLVNFDCFFDWYKNELLDEYQTKEENPRYISNELNTVRVAISKFFGETIKLKIVRDQLIATKNGVDFLFSNISDGEKSLILLFADIARRLAIANPNLENPLDGNGIILIDEIEMHLHPSWQRKVCKALKGTFPNCQFVITTHSPQVLGELKTEEIWLLNDFNVYRPDSSYGLTSNEILDEMMDVIDDDVLLSRDGNISKKIQELNLLVELGKIEAAKKLILEIEKEAGNELHDVNACKIAIEMMESE